MERKPTILILATAPLHNGPRMIREINALKDNFNITATGSTPPSEQSVKYINSKILDYPLSYKGIRKIYRKMFRRIWPFASSKVQSALNNILKQHEPEIVIVHDPLLIPYLFRSGNPGFKVVYNAHEYHPLELDEDKVWLKTWGQYYYNLYKKYLGKIDLVINVCQSIADKCREEFGKDSIVIPNAAAYQPSLKPSVPSAGIIRIIHHSVAIKERGLEIMIEALEQLGDNYQLDLMLVPGDKAYFDELKNYIQNTNNVNLIKPVGFTEIVPLINQYDIGLYNLPPVSFNNKVALPNKFFEFIQARLCLVISPSVEMKKLVEKYDLGAVSRDFTAEAIAEVLRNLSVEQISRYKQNAHAVAHELSMEHFQKYLLENIEKLNN